MNNDLKICSKLIIKLLEDKCWHDIYTIHCKYRLSPVLIVKSIQLLREKDIIVIDDQKIKKSERLDNTQLAFVNFLAKTRKPERLTKVKLELERKDMIDFSC